MSAVRHQALTLIAPIRIGNEQAVDDWLRGAERALQGALSSSTTTHFARWVVVPPSLGEDGRALGEDGRALGEGHLLAFESNFDGELADHVAELRARLGGLLDESFQHVQGYPGSFDLLELLRFFRAYSRRSAVFYVANEGLSVPVVRGDATLRRAVEERLRELSRGPRVQARSALELALDLQRTARSVAARDGLTLGFVDRGRPRSSPPLWLRALSRPFSVLVAFLLSPWFELRDERVRKRQPRFDTPELRARRDRLGTEERGDQDGLTHVVALKPGWYRAFALRLMVFIVAALTERRARAVRTVHFARWVALADGRLLFSSNYDGSWEAHVGELIERAARALTMIWSHTVGFPKTRFLLFQGARDEGAFKAWMRAHQVPTPAWYSAYPGLSAENVLQNASIREILGAELSSAKAEELLALL